MSSDVNIKTIQGVYEAFARGDVASILDVVTDDVDWATESSTSAGPWHGPHTGKQGVADFFTAFADTMEVEDFTPVSFAANDTDVMAVVRFAARNKKTGKGVAMDLHHWFVFRDGKISFYRGTEDTVQTAAAFRA
jgi:ketosteroid isomerase-like protein